MGKERIMTIIRAVLLLVMMLRMSVEGQSSMASTFMNCYTPCFVLCYLTPGKTTSTCALECLRDCIIPASPLDDRRIKTDDANNHQFCKLGCASFLCTNISTRENPSGEKVERCVGSCSKMCTKSYSSP